MGSSFFAIGSDGRDRSGHTASALDKVIVACRPCRRRMTYSEFSIDIVRHVSGHKRRCHDHNEIQTKSPLPYLADKLLLKGLA